MSSDCDGDDGEDEGGGGSAVKSQKRSDPRSWDKYPGMIVRVYMKNFMCHAELP